MKLFSTLNLDRLRGGNQPPVVIDPALNQVYLALHQIQRKRQFIEVSFDGDDVIYQSMVLEIDPHKKTLWVDELFPRGYEGLAGQAISVCVRQEHGRKLRFQSVIIEPVDDAGNAPTYLLAMPASLEGDQRRSAYRLPLPKSDIEPEFLDPDNNRHRARLNNLSVSGVGLVLKGDFSDIWHVGDAFSDVCFGFAGIDVNCELRVKSLQAVEGAVTCTLVGGEFVDLQAREQRLLARSIATMQRQRIQAIENY